MKLFRKFKVSIFTAFMFTLVFFILGLLNGLHNLGLGTLAILITAFLFSLIGCFFYGIPVSLLSDYISEKFMKSRLILSSIIHTGFGLVPLAFKNMEFGIPVLLCSIIFLIIDEILRSL